MPADAAKLMHRRLKSDRNVVLYGHMPRERRAIHKQSVVANVAIVPHVRRRQKQAAAANRSLPPAAHRAPADGHVLAKGVPISHSELRPLAAEAKVLRIAAHNAKRIKHVVAPDPGRPLDDRMLMQHAAFSQLHVLADDRICPYAHTRAQLRVRRDHRLRMNLRRAHSAASCPSTVARPSSLQKSPRQEITFISTFN